MVMVRVPSPTMLQVGRRLADALAEAGMNQAGLARRLGVSEATVSRWLNAEVAINVRQLETLATMFDKPTWYFLGAGPPDPGAVMGDKFARLDEDDKRTVADVIDSLAARRGRRVG